MAAMQDLFSPSEQISDDTLRLTFDSCWNLCSAENGGSYQAELVHTPAEGTGIMEAQITVYDCVCTGDRLFIHFLSCITPQRGGEPMSNSSKKKQFGMNIGSASILLVFVILCLVSFAVLSIVSANADSRLSTRVLERTTAYYAACNQAEQSLAGMDNTLRRVYEASDSEDAYYVLRRTRKVICDTYFRSCNPYRLPLRSYTLCLTDDTFYRITAWQVLNTEDLQ